MTVFDPTFAWKLGAVPNLAWPSRVLSRTNIPPTAPVTNDSHIVGKNPTGEWIDKQNQIAIRTSEGAWFYQVPARGRQVYVQAIKAHREWNGREWVPMSGLPPGGLTTYVLTKQTDADGDVIWTNPGLIGGGGGGGTTVKLFQKVENISGSGIEGDLAIVLGQGFGAYGERGTIYRWTSGGWVHHGAISQVGVPEGGTTGQILAKSSNDNFEVEWLDLEEAIGDITSVTAGDGLIGGGASGAVTLSLDWGTDFNEVRHGNDAAYTNARAPTGTAGGDLGATYPNPSVIALTADATRLTLGTIADGDFVQRSGATLVGVSGASAPQPVQVNGSLIGTRDAIDIVAGTGISLAGSDDSSNNRVRVTVTATGGGGGGGGSGTQSAYLELSSSPDSWNYEARTAGSPDLAIEGWTVQLADAPHTALTRSGNINIASVPSAGTYRSTIINGHLFIQLPSVTLVSIMKATTAGPYSYKSHAWTSEFATNNYSMTFVANGATTLQPSTDSYYGGLEGTAFTEVAHISGTFIAYTNITATLQQADTVKYVNDPTGGTRTMRFVMATSGIETLPRATRSLAFTTAYAGIWLMHPAGQVAHIDFIRRTPLLELP